MQKLAGEIRSLRSDYRVTINLIENGYQVIIGFGIRQKTLSSSMEIGGNMGDLTIVHRKNLVEVHMDVRIDVKICNVYLIL